MEMSRQRIRTGVLESSTEKCPYCGGTGHLRSVASVALQLLRSLEEMLIKGATHNLIVRTRAEVAIYVLNHKRAHLRDLEQRFRVAITVNADAAIAGQQSFVIDKGEQVHSLEAARAIAVQPTTVLPVHDEDDADEATDEVADEDSAVEAEAEEAEAEEAEDEVEPEALHAGGRAAEPGEADRPRRRRRRRGRGRREGGEPFGDAAPRAERGELAAQPEPHGDDHGHPREAAGEAREAAGEGLGDPERRRRRRGRRGGRRRRGRDGEVFSDAAPAFEPELDSAVADFDRPPAAERPEPVASEPSYPVASEPSYYVPPPPPPVQAETPPPQAESPPAAAPQPEPAEPAPPRRRSTVREPAPIYFSERPAESAAPEPSRPAPTPEPVAPESVAPSPAPADVAAPDQPRRTGWWSRRFAGDKG